MFDPKGFINKNKMDAPFKKFRDVYVWLLNMAALYKDCCIEDTFQNLDFFAHYFLQKQRINKWTYMFTNDEIKWDVAMNSETASEKNIHPVDFVWICKWFMHGLNGPFGSVSSNLVAIAKTFFKSNSAAKKTSSNCIKDNLQPNKQSLLFSKMIHIIVEFAASCLCMIW